MYLFYTVPKYKHSNQNKIQLLHNKIKVTLVGYFNGTFNKYHYIVY